LRYLGYLFFFLMLVVPTTFQTTRGLFLLLIIGISIISAMKYGTRIHTWIAGITLICILTSSIFMLWGSINDAPGALRVGTVYVLWPLLFIFFISVFYDLQFWKSYLKVIVIASLAVEAMCLILITDAIGMSNIGIINYIDAHIGIYDGMTQFHTANLTTLIFSIPYLLSKFLLSDTEKPGSFFWKSIEAFALIGGVVVIIFTGRRALWIVLILSPIITFMLANIAGSSFQTSKFVKLATLMVIGFIISSSLYDINLNIIWDNILTGFNFDSSSQITESAYRRKEQFQALISGWELNPLFGFGHGAAAADNAGGSEQQWAYELSYIALLFQVGIVGVVIYSGSVVWLYLRSIRLMRCSLNSRLVMIPVLTGLTTFLIANATNPYLSKFDYLWVIFLPIAFLNSYLIDAKTQKRHSDGIYISKTRKCLDS